MTTALPQLPLTLQETEILSIQNLQINHAELENAMIEHIDQKQPEKVDIEPQLIWGIQKVISNTPPIHQEDNTLFKVGVEQTIPTASVYSLKNQQLQAISAVEYKQQRDAQGQFLRQATNLWLELYYWLQTQYQIKQTQLALAQLISPPMATVQQLETTSIVQNALSELYPQLIDVEKEAIMTRQKLASLIGEKNAQRPLSSLLPAWDPPPSLHTLQAQIRHHPKIQADSAAIQAIRANTELSKEQNKSSLGIGASYGVKQDTMLDGNPKLDTLSAEFKLNLSSGADLERSSTNRNNLAELEVAQLQQEKDFLQLNNELKRNYQDWQRYTQQLISLRQEHLPAIDQELNHALAQWDWHNSVTTQALILAYQQQLRVHLEILQAEIKQAQARVNLRYFE